jgi:transient receptor potential cation channel subfamily A protein 1
MMKDEYDFGDLPFGFDVTVGVTSRLLFILFMFLVTIVMMNLLNGLAIYDIQDIKKQVHLYSHITYNIFKFNKQIIVGRDL